jgi:hypothetical protein
MLPLQIFDLRVPTHAAFFVEPKAEVAVVVPRDHSRIELLVRGTVDVLG